MIKIDGVEYRVHVLHPSLRNSFTIVEDGASGTAINGRMIRSILGTSYSYRLEFKPQRRYPEDFDALWLALSEPVEYHRVELPFGQGTLSFEAAVTGGERTWQGKSGGFQRWDGLSIDFVAMQPQWRAGEALPEGLSDE